MLEYDTALNYIKQENYHEVNNIIDVFCNKHNFDIKKLGANDLDNFDANIRKSLALMLNLKAFTIDKMDTRNKHDLLIPILKWIIKLDPDNGQYQLNISKIYMSKGELKKAKNIYQNMLSKGENYYAYRGLAEYYTVKRDYLNAKCYMKQGLKVFPKNEIERFSIDLNDLASLYYGLGNYEKYLKLSYQSLVVKASVSKNLSEYINNVLNVKDVKVLERIVNKLVSENPEYKLYLYLIRMLIREFYYDNDEINIVRTQLIENLNELTNNTNYHNKYDTMVEKVKIGLPLSYQNRNNVVINKKIFDFYKNIFPNYYTISRHVKLRYENKVKIDRPKIRVGFISSNFYNHSVSKDRRGIINKLSRDIFEVIVFMYRPPFDLMSKFISQSADKCFILSDIDISRHQKIISEQKLDVIVFADVGMDVRTYLLALGRLAPVQIATWGHSDTTGMDTIDYFISSKYFELPYQESQKNYSEKLVLLDSLGTYYYPMNMFQVNKNSVIKYKNKFGIPTSPDIHIYFVPHTLFKLYSEFDDIINEILIRDPNAYIIYLDGIKPYIKRMFYSRLEKTVKNNISRIHFLPHQKYLKDFLQVLCLSDVILDSYPFGGCNSSFEAFNLGKCIITMPSNYINGRFTYGMYKKMGILDAIAVNKEDFIEKAILIASDKNIRENLESTILSKKDLIFEEEDSVRDWNKLLLEFSSPFVNYIENYYDNHTTPIYNNNFIDMTEYQDKINWKPKDNSVLIIGNSSKIMEGEKLGNKVQSFNTVYRINYYQTNNFEEYVGNRTNNWVITDIIQWNPEYLKKVELKEILLYIPKIKKPFCNSDYVNHPKLKEMPEEIENLLSKEFYPDKNTYWSSTGLVLIKHLLENTNKNIYVMGFDGFKSNKHYYNSEPINTDHIINLEEKIMESFYNTQRVFTL